MVDEKFSSITELYKRVLPALRSKKKELSLKKINFITEKDIWDCMRDTKWNNKSNLTLFDIVNDILTISENELLDYLNKKQQER